MITKYQCVGPGQDNTDVQCTVGDVKNIFLGNIGDHNGDFYVCIRTCRKFSYGMYLKDLTMASPLAAEFGCCGMQTWFLRMSIGRHLEDRPFLSSALTCDLDLDMNCRSYRSSCISIDEKIFWPTHSWTKMHLFSCHNLQVLCKHVHKKK